MNDQIKTITLEIADPQGWVIDHQEIKYKVQPHTEVTPGPVYKNWYFLTIGDKHYQLDEIGNIKTSDIPSPSEIEAHLRDVIFKSDGDLGVAKYITEYIIHLLENKCLKQN
jgi:hypothetical protein